MARCAVCMVELGHNEKFATQDQYVVHRRCFRGRPKIAGELEAARVDAAAALARAMERIATMTTEVNRAERSERLARMAHDSVSRELTETRGELASMRTRLAVSQLAADRVRAPEDSGDRPEEKEIPEPKGDDAQIRFGLLELK